MKEEQSPHPVTRTKVSKTGNWTVASKPKMTQPLGTKICRRSSCTGRRMVHREVSPPCRNYSTVACRTIHDLATGIHFPIHRGRLALSGRVQSSPWFTVTYAASSLYQIIPSYQKISLSKYHHPFTWCVYKWRFQQSSARNIISVFTDPHDNIWEGERWGESEREGEGEGNERAK